MSRLIQGHNQSMRTQCFASYALLKLIEGFSKIQHLYIQRSTVTHNVIKPSLVYQPTKLATQKLVDVLSRGNVLNIALEIIAEIIIPPPPVYVLPSLPSAAGKLCSVCNNPICSRYTDLAYHCEDPSCHNVCHLSITCSCFLDPRGTTRAHLLYSNLALPFIFFSNSKWAFIISTWYLLHSPHFRH